jgi:hypothetical protein
MIEQVGGDLYHLLHQHHVGFNLIRYEDDIAVIARSENATYVQLFPIQPMQQELNRLETAGAFTRTQSELPSEEENDDLHEEDS